MADLKSQYLKIKEEVDFAIEAVLESSLFVKGPQVTAFEKHLAQLLNVPYVISCANGTDALQISLMALDLKPGDEVITPDFSYAAAAEAVQLLGLTPVFADVEERTFNVNAESLRAAITPKTKAMIPVHLFGQCADMETLVEIASEKGIHIVEDNAQAIGAMFKFKDGRKLSAGTIGIIGTTSFFPSKNLGCFGDGGAMFTRNERLGERLRRIANHGQSAKYVHDEIGMNSRLDTLQAAILSVKLKYLEEYTSARQRVADFYDSKLAASDVVEIPFRNPQSVHVFHQYTIKVKNGMRDNLQAYLGENGIPTMVYYPRSLHTQKAFKSDRNKSDCFPVSERLCSQVLSLPISTEMEEDQLAYITDHILEFVNNHA